MSNIVLLLILIFLILLSAFFSSSETAVFSLNRFQIKRIQKKHHFIGKLVEKFVATPHRTLMSILIGNMFVNIAASAISTALFIKWFGPRGMLFSILVVTSALLIFGEITPKRIAIRNSEALTVSFAPVLEFFARILLPFRLIVTPVTDHILKVLSVKSVSVKKEVSEEELKILMALGEQGGAIDKDEREMIDAVFEFGERSCNEIMTPRVDIIACEVGMRPDEVIDIMKQNRRTKLPVYEESIDKILGFVYTKDFMLSKHKNIRGLLKEIIFVPESQKIDELLQKFLAKQMPIAIVVDEYGGTAGLVTVEDILEEVVGEIQDEHDFEGPLVEKIGKNKIRVEGDISLGDLERETDIVLESEEFESVAGYILSILGRFPEENERIESDDIVFEVEEVKDNRITKVLIYTKNMKVEE